MTDDTDARLAQIRALIRDDHLIEYMGTEYLSVSEVRAILDAPPVSAPVEGVVLTPEDTALIAECLTHITTAPHGFHSREKQEHARALAARLEAG